VDHFQGAIPRDGQVRYVGQTEYTARKRLDLIVTKALENEPGALHDWLRDEWRQDFDVRARVLQDDIIPADLEMFEHYWIEQFGGLLNVKPPSDPQRQTSETGQCINEAIRAELKGDSAA
jgi:hypothetical protein